MSCGPLSEDERTPAGELPRSHCGVKHDYRRVADDHPASARHLSEPHHNPGTAKRLGGCHSWTEATVGTEALFRAATRRTSRLAKRLRYYRHRRSPSRLPLPYTPRLPPDEKRTKVLDGAWLAHASRRVFAEHQTFIQGFPHDGNYRLLLSTVGLDYSRPGKVLKVHPNSTRSAHNRLVGTSHPTSPARLGSKVAASSTLSSSQFAQDRSTSRYSQEPPRT